MTIVRDATICGIVNDVSRSINDTFRSAIDISRVMLQIVASHTIIVYYRNMFVVQGTIGNIKKLL